MDTTTITTRKATTAELAASKRSIPPVPSGLENTKQTRSAGRYYGQTLDNPSPHFRTVKNVEGLLLIAEPHGYADGGAGDKFGYVNTGEADGKLVWEKVPAREVKAGDTVIYVIPAFDAEGRRVVSRKARLGINQHRRDVAKAHTVNGRFADAESEGPSGLKTFACWFAPGEEPTHPNFIGKPVDVEASYLIELVSSGEANAENRARLAVLVADVVLEEARQSPSGVHFDDIVSLVQERFFERVSEGKATDNFHRVIRTMTGDAVADVKTFVEYASRVGNGSTTKRIDAAYAAVTAEGSTMDPAPSPHAVAEKTAEITRPLDKSRMPSVETVKNVMAGSVHNAEIEEAISVVSARLERQYRFSRAVRVSDDPKATIAAQQHMLIDEVRDEVGRMGSTPGVGFDRAYAISNAKAVVAIDHNDGARTDDDGEATDKPRDGSIHAHSGLPLSRNTVDLARYDQVFQAIGMLKKSIHKDLAWYLFGEDDNWTHQEIADKYGKTQQAISLQLKTVRNKVEATLLAMLNGEIEVEYGEPGTQSLEATLQALPDQRDEQRDVYRWWYREDAKRQRASMYSVDASEAFSGTLKELFEATRLGGVSLREFCGWMQLQGKEAWQFSSAPQMFDQTRREYLDHGATVPTRSEDTERDIAWRRFEGWFTRL